MHMAATFHCLPAPRKRSSTTAVTPPHDAASAAELGPLQLRKQVSLTLTPLQHTADIAISGLGWVAVSALPTLRASTDEMRCEMACAATHFTWEAPSCPPASCALAAARRQPSDGAEAGVDKGNVRSHGVLATLLRILDNRRLRRADAAGRVAADAEHVTRRCPCEQASEAWYY